MKVESKLDGTWQNDPEAKKFYAGVLEDAFDSQNEHIIQNSVLDLVVALALLTAVAVGCEGWVRRRGPGSIKEMPKGVR